eukprot:CAMPEP_0185796626 /NCGR_PEP_ID=MMETSP1174-20130828/161188_1 /TAXON_ID=35687 /ORGANISM="Dictyocha speculum, Strain CCMP1381" /LENGTH=77 /DNA_ID=CAMNT_0028492013 /DNA_START=765 /DNA_END=998 /DNA_ORIENTATION=+
MAVLYEHRYGYFPSPAADFVALRIVLKEKYGLCRLPGNMAWRMTAQKFVAAMWSVRVRVMAAMIEVCGLDEEIINIA